MSHALLHQAFDALNSGDAIERGVARSALREALARPEQASHAVVAGALFDFVCYLTSRKERIVLSAADAETPAVVAIIDFSTKRGLSLDGAWVREWVDALSNNPI